MMHPNLKDKIKSLWHQEIIEAGIDTNKMSGLDIFLNFVIEVAIHESSQKSNKICLSHALSLCYWQDLRDNNANLPTSLTQNYLSYLNNRSDAATAQAGFLFATRLSMQSAQLKIDVLQEQQDLEASVKRGALSRDHTHKI